METNELDLRSKIAVLESEIESIKNDLYAAKVNAQQLEAEAITAKAKAKEQAWYAQELGKFIADVANCRYEGQEIAAAKRVYNLNSGSINRKRLNAHNYDSLEEARRGYLDYLKGKPYEEIGMMAWLFKEVEE